ncbi:hypothetical protein [Arenimonas sp. MALMAid1274]|uniref:hypothetical protein n=1 Tax=Arenimonas sp. MALMAid1274 TaxID=3411630 RepID=UPI003BA2EE87
MAALLRTALICTLLFAPAAALAEDAKAPAAEAPPIQIVNEGGLAETYRRDGGDFASYGPDGKALVPTPEAQALQALQVADRVEFIALDGAAGGKDPVPCPASDCVGAIAVLARASVQSREHRGLVRDVLGGWLGSPVEKRSACAPRYRHAITYVAGGHAWEVLLCFDCGQYAIFRDGAAIGHGEAAQTPGQAQLDQVLAAPR